MVKNRVVFFVVVLFLVIVTLISCALYFTLINTMEKSINSTKLEMEEQLKKVQANINKNVELDIDKLYEDIRLLYGEHFRTLESTSLQNDNRLSKEQEDIKLAIIQSEERLKREFDGKIENMLLKLSKNIEKENNITRSVIVQESESIQYEHELKMGLVNESISNSLDNIMQYIEMNQTQVVQIAATTQQKPEEQANLSAEKDLHTITKRIEAKKMFDIRKYKESSILWSEILVLQPDDFEARFYSAYSLYLYNPLDSSQYNKVMEDFDLLQRNGYVRDEIDEVKSIILLEQGESKNEI